MTLKSMKEMRGFTIGAADGDLGKVDDLYFDDERWTVRYVVADVGHWLRGRKVLVSPHAIVRIDSDGETVATPLTRAQVESSPPIETDRPISRRLEAEYNRYYGYPPYWAGTSATALWGFGALPLAGMQPVSRSVQERRAAERPPSADAMEARAGDVHLRSCREVTGYRVAATDGDIGHVEDFLLDENDWSIGYLVIDPRDWWPGRHVLVSPQRVDAVSWTDRSVHLDIARFEVERSPEYDPRRPPESPVAIRA